MDVLLHKAQSIRDELAPEDLYIRVLQSLPKHASMSANAETMRVDAVNLVYALRNTLPQGTWARIVTETARTWAEDQAGSISAANWYAKE